MEVLDGLSVRGTKALPYLSDRAMSSSKSFLRSTSPIHLIEIPNILDTM